MKILADATLPGLLTWFPEPFSLTVYHSLDELRPALKTHDILLCRSTLKVAGDLLADSSIRCVATASSGVDHIDEAYLQENNIRLLDAKGSNARSVADYVLACIAVLQQQNALQGLRAGVIGLGEVGSRVFKRLQSLGFEVIGFDPLKALNDIEDLMDCDLLCVHANLHDAAPFPSRNLLDAAFFKQVKNNMVIINAARGGIVNEQALLNADKSIRYCTDVYANEPEIDARIVDFAMICTPHIAGHSIEAKQRSVIQLSQKLHRHYGLPIIPFTETSSEDLVFDLNWQKQVLALYNPLDETAILKSASDKNQAFLTQRAAHTKRHEFTW